MNHEKELSEAVNMAKEFIRFKKESSLRVIGLDGGKVQVMDCRIFGVPLITTETGSSQYTHQLSFVYNGIKVLSIHTEEEMCEQSS